MCALEAPLCGLRKKLFNSGWLGGMREQALSVSDDARAMTLPGHLWLAMIALLLLVVVSALAVVHSSYKSRQLFSELQQDKREAMRLEENWGRLLLEQSTWASHSRVERLAKSQLNMVAPESESIVVVTQ